MDPTAMGTGWDVGCGDCLEAKLQDSVVQVSWKAAPVPFPWVHLEAPMTDHAQLLEDLFSSDEVPDVTDLLEEVES